MNGSVVQQAASDNNSFLIARRMTRTTQAASGDTGTARPTPPQSAPLADNLAACALEQAE